MPKPNPITALATRLVQALQHGGADFLTLAQLAARLDPPADLADVSKALGRKAFKDQAIVAAKKAPDAPVALVGDIERLADSPLLVEFAVGLLSTEKKPLHPVAKVVVKVDARLREPFAAALRRRIDAGDLPPHVAVVRVKDASHLCLRVYLPRLAPEVELAGKLLRTLEEHRRRGTYPLALDALIGDTDPRASAELVEKTLAAKAFKPHVVLALPDDPHTPVALKGDVEALARFPGLIEMLLATVRTADNQAIPPTDLAKKLARNLRAPFVAAVAGAALPPAVGRVVIKAKPYLFLVRDVGPAPAAPPQPQPIDFPVRFDEAFGDLDRRTGSHNFVSLVDLRRALPVERDAFDEGLRRLRQAGRYTLSGAEGRHGLTDEERAAGVNENGALLLYVSRRKV